MQPRCKSVMRSSQSRVPTVPRMRLGWHALLGTALYMTSSVSLAAEAFASPRAAEPVASSPVAGLAQVTLSLLLVLAAVFAAAWAMRRLRSFGRLAPGAIEVIADVALGPKERAVLIQVGDKQLLLGVAAGQVNTLHVLDNPIAVPPRDSVLKQPNPDSSAATGRVPAHLQFKTILKRSLGL